MHCAPTAIDMSSAKGLSFCVTRDRVVRPDNIPGAEDVIGTDREAVIREFREARTRAGLTQEQAAGLRKNRATSTISRWESGGLPNSWDDLSEYAHALGQEIVLRFGPHKEAAPPDWAERLLAGVFALEAKGGISADELEAAQARVAAYLVVARRARPQQEGDGATGGASA